MKNFFKIFGIIALAAVIVCSMAACNDGGSGSDGEDQNPGKTDTPPDPTVTPIEAAFTNMLKANFHGYYVSGSDVTVSAITKMSNWGQTNSEYAVNAKGSLDYKLPSSFGTVPVMSSGSAVIISGGAGVVLMTGPNASIIWGTPTGDTSYVSGSSSWFYFSYFSSFTSGSDVKTVTYPYTVSVISGNDAQIEGKLNLNLSKEKYSEPAMPYPAMPYNPLGIVEK